MPSAAIAITQQSRVRGQDLRSAQPQGLEGPEYIHTRQRLTRSPRGGPTTATSGATSKAAAAATPGNGNVGIESASGMAAVKSADSQRSLTRTRLGSVECVRV